MGNQGESSSLYGRFLAPGAGDILGWGVLHGRGRPMHCRVFSSVPGCHPLDSSSTHHLRCDDQKGLQTMSHALSTTSLLPMENHCSKERKRADFSPRAFFFRKTGIVCSFRQRSFSRKQLLSSSVPRNGKQRGTRAAGLGVFCRAGEADWRVLRYTGGNGQGEVAPKLWIQGRVGISETKPQTCYSKHC